MDVPVRSALVVHLLLLIQALRSTGIPMWWNLGMQGLDVLQNPQHYQLLDDESLCHQLQGLSPNQIRFCNTNQDHMTSVSRGAKLGIHECQWQFRFRRWNCSTVDDTSVFGPIVNIGSRETAFVNSIAAAGVVYAVAKACRQGEIASCACGINNAATKRPRGLNRDWLWDGCGDNTEYGYNVAEAFIDAREKEKNHPRRSAELARTIMNLHNNMAGRRSVSRHIKVGCKCHGVSGSCSVKTCWYQLPSFREAGDLLKERYDSATQVKFNKHGTKLRQTNKRFNKPTSNDLIYLDDSPDYCEHDPDIGSAGTAGRYCNKTSEGMDGCDLMCCGRGYNTYREKVKFRCHCKFQWCCFVKCDTCENMVDFHKCK